jgi:hypothetical protein
VAHDVRIFRFDRIINPDAQQVSIVCCLRTDNNQQRVFMRPLRGSYCIDKIILRPSYLPGFIENGQNR